MLTFSDSEVVQDVTGTGRVVEGSLYLVFTSVVERTVELKHVGTVECDAVCGVVASVLVP